MNPDSSNPGGEPPSVPASAPAPSAGAEGAQTLPLQPPQPQMPMQPPPGYPMGYPPGWAPPGYGPPGYAPHMQMPLHPMMPPPPGWPPGYPMPPQMMPGYPAPYPYPGMPMPFPLPPVAPMAPPVAQPVAVVEAEPVVVAALVAEAQPPVAKAAAAPAPASEVVASVEPKAPAPPSTSASAPATAASAPSSAANAMPEVPTQAAAEGGSGAGTGMPETKDGPAGDPGPAVHDLGLAPVLRLNPGASASSRGPNGFVRLWRKVGAGSLMLSLLIHGGLLVVAGLVALTVSMQEAPVDFLPGGGTQQGADASSDLSEQMRVKARKSVSKALPKSRLVSTSINSSITLPEAPTDALDVPDMSAALGGGRLGSNGGFGLGGAGGGFGNGLGSGALSGVTFKPLMMFGVELKDTRKIAVVMDVSRSMTKYLPIVVKELDKVAKGSPVVMYFGCGLAKPPRRKSDVDDKVRKAEGDDFASFWQNWEGDTPVNLPMEDRKKLRYDPAKKMPLDDIYQMMSKRPSTYYLDFSGIGYAWTALMSNEVKEADAVYWFADFQDKVDEEQMDAVRRRFKARKQKLFIHASTRGRFFEQVRDHLVLPTEGEVVEVELPKK